MTHRWAVVAVWLVAAVGCGGGGPDAPGASSQAAPISPQTTASTVLPVAEPSAKATVAPSSTGATPADETSSPAISTAASLVPSTTQPWTTVDLGSAPDDWIDLGALPGIDVSGALDINDQGAIVGYSYVGEYEMYGVWWPDPLSPPQRLDDLVDAPDAEPFTSATRINDAGQVLAFGEGVYVIDLPRGVATEIVPSFGRVGADGVYFLAEDLNDRGQVVGSVEIDAIPPEPGVTGNGTSITRAFLWDVATGEMADLGIPTGATSCGATAINDRGQVVGSCDDRPVAWNLDTGEIQRLAGSTIPGALSDLGLAISRGSSSRLWDLATGEVLVLDVQIGDINDLGQICAAGYAINDLGQVVSWGGSARSSSTTA
ncbi:MAG: hypothetical protein QNJ12_11355 [Ilumatobacter sp.]|uniref:hypothetical protein n=1 Tax=Ilumatobacter sp. TaxID=1967498 RepID=UPI002611DEAF|nr:hypothetical protein [Ilumatobacter sp.]MDJ0769387.1 hypothetical protein [Ilumatobacter sp.]